MLEGTGLTFLFRCNLAGRVYYPSRLMAMFDHDCIDPRNPDGATWKRIADAVQGCDLLFRPNRRSRPKPPSARPSQLRDIPWSSPIRPTTLAAAARTTP